MPGNSISCVYFSLICEAKGADRVIEAARMIPQVSFHFYGRIACEYKEAFRSAVESLSNIEYHGVFDSISNDVFAELNKYDLHLFPSECASEGVPGVLVETKIAAVPSIVSNASYNAEIVNDGVDGMVLKENTAECLAAAIKELDVDRMLLDQMKASALASAGCYYIDQYIDIIVAELEA